MNAAPDAQDGHHPPAAPTPFLPELDALRRSIDRIDRAAADLLIRRARTAQRVALYKQLHRLPRRDEGREREVRQRYADRLGPAGWSDACLDTWLDTMILVSRTLQDRLRVAVQGGPGCWSEVTLRQVLPDVEPLRCATFAEAWRRAHAGDAVAAWLPVANSTTGPIDGGHEAGADADCWLEQAFAVGHVLLGPPGLALERVARVEGHPQALAQCARTLARVVPSATLVPTLDGFASAARLGADEATAVVGGAHLADGRLRVLHAPLADAADNRTTFRLLLPKANL